MFGSSAALKPKHPFFKWDLGIHSQLIKNSVFDITSRTPYILNVVNNNYIVFNMGLKYHFKKS